MRWPLYDSINDALGVNTHLQWNIRPGRDLFLIFNHGFEPRLTDINQAPPTGNSVIVKLHSDTNW